MFDLSCKYCEGNLEILPTDHPEYSQTQLTFDGTRKWFLCHDCKGVWCYDKVQKTWLMSPQTYTNWVNEGKIPNLLDIED